MSLGSDEQAIVLRSDLADRRLRVTLSAMLLLAAAGFGLAGQHYIRAQPRYANNGVQISGAIDLAVAVLLLATAIAILSVANRPAASFILFIVGILVVVAGLSLGGHFYSAGASCGCDGG